MSRDQVRGAGTVTAVQRTMNAAVAECLEELGFLVAWLGSSGCSLVTDVRTW
jgi:2-methylisocitrate lyase-like PEP mutase family enzyme